MQLKKYEVDALVSEISSGKKSSKNLTISNVKLQAFLRRPASGQQASSIQNFNLDDGHEGFADALLQFADAANEIGAKAQARPHHPSQLARKHVANASQYFILPRTIAMSCAACNMLCEANCATLAGTASTCS